MCIFCLNDAPHYALGPFDGGRFDGPGRSIFNGTIITEDADAPATADTRVSIEPEETFEGTIDTSDDVDQIRVWLEQGATYQIDLTGRDNGANGPLPDTTLTLRDNVGIYIAENDDGGDALEARLLHTAAYTGWHVLQAEGFNTETGDYALTVVQQSFAARDENLGDAEGNDTTDYFLAEGTKFIGAYDFRGDIDWVEIFLEAGNIYRFTVDGDGDGWPEALDPQLWLFDDTGTQLAYDDDDFFDDNAVFTYAVEETGTYYLSTSHAQDAGTGFYDIEFFQVVLNYQNEYVDETFDAAASTSTAETISVGGTYGGVIDRLSDEDWLAVTLQAGETYSLRVEDHWWFWDTLHDPHLALHDSSGTLIEADDNDGPGADAAIQFTPDTSGTYYMAISSAEDGGTGIGYYEVSVRDEATAADPMNAIDWGTGTLPTDGSPVQVFFSPSQWFVSPDAETQIRLSDYTEQEITFFMEALDTISAFTPLTFAQTSSAFDADMIVGKSDLKGFSGFANPPGSGWLPESAIVMDDWEGYWTQNLMQTGSFTHATILHEAGHALGLAHPHDTGGNSEIMRGVLSSNATGGDIAFDLNQFPFTIMSYNQVWDGLDAIPSFSDGIGGLGTFGALDIAALQTLYGTAEHKTGNTTYRLTQNDWFETIWDTGGTDTIRAGGTTDAVIDLTAATLDYSATGGGVVSYQSGAFGGFTIAAGVQIERAFGARGDDTITGNALDNHLRGSNGMDTLIGNDGADLLEGGRGLDTLIGGEGADTIRGGAGGDTIYGNVAGDLLLGNAGNDTIYGGNGGDTIDGGRGNDVIEGGTGNDTLQGGAGADVFVFADGDGTDTILAFQDIDLIDLTAYGTALSFGDLAISSETPDAARITIAGSSTVLEFADLRTLLADYHFDFADAVA
jgi:Ca2+-binding RTX toxin-like protein